MYFIEVIVEHRAFDLETGELWNNLSATHPEYIGVEMGVGRTDSAVLYEDYGDFLNKKNYTSIRADLRDGTIFYNSIYDFKFARLDIKNLISSELDAEKWIDFLFTDPRFIQARLYDGKYDEWENMECLLSFQVAGRDYRSLPRKSNGLPFPVEEEIVDISNNPGRWSLKKGYVESLGSTMWLGEQFWENSGTSKEKVLTCDWLQIEEIDSVIKLRAQQSPFISSDGKEGELQNKLRELLYTH